MKLFHVDAFADKVFEGNPAIVCILEQWLSDKTMLQIAKENNLSETAFCIIKDDVCDLRWFTPQIEIDLCGHATLATAYVLFEQLRSHQNEVVFQTMSGLLKVTKDKDELYSMVFPIRKGEPVEITENMVCAIGKKPMEAYRSRDLMLVYETEEEIRSITPNVGLLHKTDEFGIIVTAKGNEVDFVSRYFAPNCGILEDPVTGSSHCTLVPYWAEKLRKVNFVAKQLSERGGTLYCSINQECITVGGYAVLFSKGDMNI